MDFFVSKELLDKTFCARPPVGKDLACFKIEGLCGSIYGKCSEYEYHGLREMFRYHSCIDSMGCFVLHGVVNQGLRCQMVWG